MEILEDTEFLRRIINCRKIMNEIIKRREKLRSQIEALDSQYMKQLEYATKFIDNLYELPRGNT